ncbi:hypothetical protein [Aestuariirhabdus litorea]|uniref:Uncharacterized protein n=1 Tax=Aestuariirhabdus litorea TaxID=2528527 RepID=A0A3P3VNZ1_9GAMM|nr:hypothetical protein [Aestuariirhabdus litorea]RRJ84067.1 hypothetical protein D0544_02805 [Aestuariirhabdus litorea]RWW97287.1 hypothetical protein DZC74_02800 [Endozoicomonadaceae bacterium GTF-13]
MRLSILLLTCLLALGGCATRQPPVPGLHDAPASAGDEQLGWRRILIQQRWDPQTTPDWNLEPLLAAELLGPSIDRHRPGLRYWRFHRRAANDSAGHQFSLLLYTDGNTARQLYQELLDHPWTAELLATDIQRIRHRGINQNSEPAVEDRSDPSWSPEMQRAWPAYITGVSELWLGLIREYRSQAPAPQSLAEARPRYARINRQLTELWQAEGQHALLHHLNALFGYQPLLIRY